MRLIQFPVERLDEFTSTRAKGFKEAVLSKGKVDGGVFSIAADDWQQLTLAYLPRPGIGLGDAVAKVAQPIAKAIDAVLGTNVQGCGGCKQRQAALNKLVPRL